MTTLKIQLANTPTGEYDVDKPRPYPYFIDAETGDVTNQDLWKGDPLRLAGFQESADNQRVSLWPEDWADDPQRAVGMFPVFQKLEGGMYSMTLPVSEVTDVEL